MAHPAKTDYLEQTHEADSAGRNLRPAAAAAAPLSERPVRANAEAQEKIFSLIKDIRVALLGTQDAEGRLHARPMVAAKLEKFEGKLWFFTPADCPKVAEVEANSHVLLSYSKPDDQHYVSLNGCAHVVRDPAKVKELWNEHLRTWFAKGPEDPNIALIHVHIEEGEYWDSPSSALIYAYGYAKARLTGKPLQTGEFGAGENEKVRF